MTISATVTGDTGAGLAMAAQTFTAVRSFELTAEQMLLLTLSDGRVVAVDISTETTLTLTVSGGNYTLTVAT